MIRSIIPEVPIGLMYHNGPAEAVQLGESYLVYNIIFRELPSGGTEVDQFISLSMISDDGVNADPFVCGAIRMSGDDMRFLHTDTINELLRQGDAMLRRWLAQRPDPTPELDGPGP